VISKQSALQLQNGIQRLLSTSIVPNKFNKIPLSQSSDLNTQQFLDWAAPQLNVKEVSDWYKVTNKVKIENFD
jgi:hypothetical protein